MKTAVHRDSNGIFELDIRRIVQLPRRVLKYGLDSGKLSAAEGDACSPEMLAQLLWTLCSDQHTAYGRQPQEPSDGHLDQAYSLV